MKELIESNIDTQTQQAVHQFVTLLRAQQFDVLQTVLFGSRARGEATEDSDADVAVIFADHFSHTKPTRMQLNDLAYDVLLDTGINIQALALSQSQWSAPQTFSNPRLIQNIDRDGVRF